MTLNSMALSGVVHLDPTNPKKIYNPETGRYVFLDGQIGQSLLRKYGDISSKNPKTIDYDVLDIIQNQISQYREYLVKEPYNNEADIISDALDKVQKSFIVLQISLSKGVINKEEQLLALNQIIEGLINVFNALQKHGFRVGRAKYPGPNNAWKNLVSRVLI